MRKRVRKVREPEMKEGPVVGREVERKKGYVGFGDIIERVVVRVGSWGSIRWYRWVVFRDRILLKFVDGTGPQLTTTSSFRVSPHTTTVMCIPQRLQSTRDLWYDQKYQSGGRSVLSIEYRRGVTGCVGRDRSGKWLSSN